MKAALRQEKKCLNCGATVHGRYCSECGQENREPRESFGQLLYHFISDFTHFDSKVFVTIKDLLFEPGFLTKEYLAGRRVRYLHPIRMYIFISFLYFLCMGLVRQNDHKKDVVLTTNQRAVASKVNATLDTIKTVTPGVDSATINSATKGISRAARDISNMRSYGSVKEFDSIQHALPPDKRLKGIERFLERKLVKWKEKYGSLSSEMLTEKFYHAIPKIMFFLLPLLALFLKWFYKKEHYYVDHAILSLHFHSVAFLLMLLFLLADTVFHLSILGDFTLPLLFIYLVLALRNVYHQSLMLSLFKGLAVSILYLVSIGIVLGLAALIIFVTI
ncbi:MAG TPA: DUF3667 domain-containing protein [Chitinophagaceae bacterium]|jgi:hypothetical protein|nr:DUF3667 domain-containing protein [Chitinophagaceae bacterium]